MLNRRRVLLGGTALAAAAAISNVAFAEAAFATRLPERSPVGEEVIAWLRANAHPLATAEPGSGYHDLEPLRAILGKARIVSLGEATHGTREFFQLKHRLIEFCIAELGFTVIAFEASYGATLAVNDYVLHGKGNAIDAVAAMEFWCWNTEEVLALVEWVRAWNVRHERKVKFYGLDVQSAAAATLHLLDYLARVAPDLAAASEAGLAPLASYFTSGELANFSITAQENTLALIKGVLDAFDAERARWIARSSEHEWCLARQSAAVLEQYAGMQLIDGEVEGFTFRDRAMADNAGALLAAESPDAKAVLWAHNGHVQRTPFLDLPNMGSFLHAAFGAQQVVVGFSFNRGAFGTVRWSGGKRELRDHVVGPPPDGFLDAALAATGMPLLALDLTRVPPDGPVSTWMASKPVQRNIAGNFTPETEYRLAAAADPRDNYDVMVFVETTTAARRNPDVWSALAPDTGAGSNEAPKNLALAGTGGAPDGWRMTDAYEGGERSPHMVTHAVTGSDSGSPAGGATVRIARAGAWLAWGDGALVQDFPAEQWRGRRLVFSAAVRAEAPHIGTGAQLLVKVTRTRSAETTDGAKAAKPLVALQAGGAVRASEWTRRSVAVDIPTNAERVQISLIVTGNSAGWFGDLKLEATAAVHGEK